ncbi:hypothetical protein PR048_009076 [Dryococelus australis]|uniref:MADF domain-containing protein n=1 Tax=Dryococelus australis TaxID=614101 RepID=A0ABQ9HYW8_9NEOP|nr:hypothetical protein PR048_009076 [Dryococelus australis]
MQTRVVATGRVTRAHVTCIVVLADCVHTKPRTHWRAAAAMQHASRRVIDSRASVDWTTNTRTLQMPHFEHKGIRRASVDRFSTYKQYPVLWNPIQGEYYKKPRKQDAWREIAAKIGVTSPVVSGEFTSPRQLIRARGHEQEDRVNTALEDGEEKSFCPYFASKMTSHSSHTRLQVG